MLNRKLYIVIIIFSVLFFSAHKSRACSRKVPNYKIHCNFLKKPIQASRTQDFLINLDDNDDDETTPRTRHRLSKPGILLSVKFTAYLQQGSPYLLGSAVPGFSGAYFIKDYLFAKTPISIAIRCLRI